MGRRFLILFVLATSTVHTGCTVLVPTFAGLRAASENRRSEERGEEPRAAVGATIAVNTALGFLIDAALVGLMMSQLDLFDYGDGVPD